MHGDDRGGRYAISYLFAAMIEIRVVQTFPSPVTTSSDVSPELVLAIFVLLALVGFAYALLMAVRLRDAVPVLVCVGSLLCAFNEPIYDILGAITYADDHAVAFTLMGREIPWFLVAGYLPWVGVTPWVISRSMAAGLSRRAMHVLAAGSFLSVVVVEALGTSLHAWTYSAPMPIEWLVVAPQMAVVPLLGAFLLFVLEPWARGWRRLVMIAPPLIALPATYAASSWPMYAAAYGDVPGVVRWGAALVSAALLVGMVAAIAAATDMVRRVRVANGMGPASPSAPASSERELLPA